MKRALIVGAILLCCCLCINMYAKEICTPGEHILIGPTITGHDVRVLFNYSCETLDREYILVDMDKMENFLEKDNTDEYDYVAESFDCDDFALRLLGNFKGYEWGNSAIGVAIFDTDENYHMTIVFIDTNKEIWIVDYDDEIKRLPNEWEIRFVMI